MPHAKIVIATEAAMPGRISNNLEDGDMKYPKEILFVG